MLNVPETVKTLFKADGIRKNFRVQFPNGELSDITNDDIVQESVRFTESLCSQDVLKFGLTEASVLEFETVGVANMYGMTIEAGIEIDLSSLSASDLAEITAGTWDGTYVAEADSDIGYGYFRVPYGVFRVESCPRDHQTMTHRRVQAYALTKQINDSVIEKNKLELTATYSETYTPNIEKLLYASAGFSTPKFLDALTKTTFKTWETWPPDDSLPGAMVYSYSKTGYPSYSITVTISDMTGAAVVFGNDSGEYDPDELYALELAGSSNVDNAIQQVSDRIDQWGIPAVTDNKPEILAAIRNYIQITLKGSPKLSSDSGSTIYYSVDDDIPVFYPYFGNAHTTLTIPKSAKVTMRYVSGSTVASQIYLTLSNIYGSAPTIYKYSGIESNIKPIIQPTGNNGTRFQYAGAYSISDYIDGYLELLAYFGKTSRDGSFEKIRLSNSFPVSVLPGDYSGFWWDEYDVLPIGTVKYSFINDQKVETTVFYQIGTGGSLYDMTGNELIKSLNSAETINALLDDYFAPHLDPVTFTPIDMTMRGLPYLEAVDYLAVTAEDGVTAYSFNMRQEISGVQALSATVESTSGDIIESEEGE